jgi:hypothetical protein
MLSALGSDGNWCHFDDLETIKVFNSRFKRRQYQIGKPFVTLYSWKLLLF